MKTLNNKQFTLLGKEAGASFSWDAYSSIHLLCLSTYDKIRLEPQAFYFGSEVAEYQLNDMLIDPLTNTGYSSYYKDEFGLMNIQFKLPLNINYKNFDIEAAWIYNMPQTMNDGFSYSNNSVLRFSIGYIFSL